MKKKCLKTTSGKHLWEEKPNGCKEILHNNGVWEYIPKWIPICRACGMVDDRNEKEKNKVQDLG